MTRVIAVCISKEKGTRKEAIAEGVFKQNYGLINDAHADFNTHRQVSLLAIESIEKMRRRGFDVHPGDFAENITTQGVDLVSMPLGIHFTIGSRVILELTQIGKECHSGCAIFKQTGRCIMPKEGVFARVIHGGKVKAGDQIKIDSKDEHQ